MIPHCTNFSPFFYLFVFVFFCPFFVFLAREQHEEEYTLYLFTSLNTSEMLTNLQCINYFSMLEAYLYNKCLVYW